MKNKKPVLYLVVPCYNEQAALYENSFVMLNKLLELEKRSVLSSNSKVLFVNDGSTDDTEKVINSLVKKNKKFAIVSFVNNAGHQNAIYAGMMEARKYADIVITIDADLQQDINALDKFIDSYNNGNDVVFGVRNDRRSDKPFKKITASIYYSIMGLMGCNILPNSADYRLLSKKALGVLSNYKETNLFLRGLIPLMGFKSDTVYFNVKDRTQGESKYTFKKMFNLALSGVTSFSIVPIHLICLFGGILTLVGIIAMLANIIMLCRASFDKLYLLFSISILLFGIVISSIGVIGEYIGAICQEVKSRPRYIVDYTIVRK